MLQQLRVGHQLKISHRLNGSKMTTQAARPEGHRIAAVPSQSEGV